MARSSTLPLHNRALGGTLIPLLEGWRDDGLSLQEMAYRLRSEHEINVATSTIGRWLRDLTEPESAA